MTNQGDSVVAPNLSITADSTLDNTVGEDLLRLYPFLLDQDAAVAERALQAIRQGVEVLRSFPFTCRKAAERNPFLRELIVSFEVSGYVALFEIESDQQVTILAIRLQREDDYY